jgi:hypothetical protein
MVLSKTQIMYNWHRLVKTISTSAGILAELKIRAYIQSILIVNYYPKAQP